ncbi:Hypothetical predicted protein [Cloeon dipterum]|uniref:Phosphodiesterase n=1 Tax=Cloeon dipterum TaxID=197152 RepID=A0A8S1D9F9_9INSE|nr:Hypothetical predicted protein [Cloeon dipterum]
MPRKVTLATIKSASFDEEPDNSSVQVRPQKFNGGVNISGNADQNGASEEQVSSYLKAHPEFLDQWLMEEVDLEQLERWMIRKMQRDKKKQSNDANGKVGRKTSLSRWKFCVHADKRQMLQELTHSLQTRPDRSNVLWELASCICSAVSADGFRLYLADPNLVGADNLKGSELIGQYLGHDLRADNGEPLLIPISSPTTVPEFVARSREPLRLSRGSGDQRFPVPSPRSEGKDDSVLEAEHALWQPIVQADSEMTGVLFMWRRQGPAFHEEDEEIARSYLVWGGIALHYAQLFLSIDKTRRLNDFLLKVVKSIFQDMVSMDALVVKVMTYAQRLVDADRASLFLVDSRNKELYARIFDMGTDESKDSEENSSTRGKEIRFPLGTGIAGQVALTGEVLNITDAYSDPRFNRTVDQLTGYHTKTILCMPIFIRGIIIGVVQMVNKRSGLFTKEDEEAFETFAVYCGLALHHAKLYEKIQRSEQKYRVALDVLSYHNTCSEEEVRMMKQMTDIDPGEPDTDTTNSRAVPMDSVGSPSLDVASYYFNIYSLDDMKKVRYAVSMFSELFGMSRFDQDSIIRFTLTVRKNYRRVPYHNWAHGFSVANSMFSIIKHSKTIFKPNECLALYIGSLCHDLDHRGKNNKFMLDTESPLASIYSTSTMEHHHFNQTITILQQEGHNIFSKLSSEEYKQVLSNIKHCILATDLALFFPNKARLAKIVEDDQFSWTNPEHRRKTTSHAESYVSYSLCQLLRLPPSHTLPKQHWPVPESDASKHVATNRSAPQQQNKRQNAFLLHLPDNSQDAAEQKSRRAQELEKDEVDMLSQDAQLSGRLNPCAEVPEHPQTDPQQEAPGDPSAPAAAPADVSDFCEKVDAAEEACLTSVALDSMSCTMCPSGLLNPFLTGDTDALDVLHAATEAALAVSNGSGSAPAPIDDFSVRDHSDTPSYFSLPDNVYNFNISDCLGIPDDPQGQYVSRNCVVFTNYSTRDAATEVEYHFNRSLNKEHGQTILGKPSVFELRNKLTTDNTYGSHMTHCPTYSSKRSTTSLPLSAGSYPSMSHGPRPLQWSPSLPQAFNPSPSRCPLPSVHAFNAYWSGEYHSASCPNTPLQHPTASGQQVFQFNSSITAVESAKKSPFAVLSRRRIALAKGVVVDAISSP